MRKQLFGWTELTAPIGGYVKFVAVFAADDGGRVLAVRNERGEVNEIVLPSGAAIDTAHALISGDVGSRETNG